MTILEKYSHLIGQRRAGTVDGEAVTFEVVHVKRAAIGGEIEVCFDCVEYSCPFFKTTLDKMNTADIRM